MVVTYERTQDALDTTAVKVIDSLSDLIKSNPPKRAQWQVHIVWFMCVYFFMCPCFDFVLMVCIVHVYVLDLCVRVSVLA